MHKPSDPGTKISLFHPILIFLQEVTLSSEQILAQVSEEFDGLSNIDPNDPHKPGTAVLWRKETEVVVSNIVPLRLQVVYSDLYGNFINIYAPTGNQGEKMRRTLFSEDLFYLINFLPSPPTLIGNFNFII